MRFKVLTVSILATALTVFPGLSGADTIYRWTDENGTVHFGATPPDDVDATAVNTASPKMGTTSAAEEQQAASETPPASGSAEAAVAEEEMTPAAKVRQERAERRREADKENAEVAAKCQAMQSQLAWTEPHPRVIVSTPDGGTRRLDDGERMEMVNEAKDYIAKHDCD